MHDEKPSPELEPWQQPPAPGTAKTMVAVLVVGLVLGGLCCVGFVAATMMGVAEIENSRQKAGHPARALGGLRSISTSQALFREGDKDNDGLNDYATLTELGQAKLIDEELASGTKWGYVFNVQPSVHAPEWQWTATANPEHPDAGQRYFATNQSGTTYYSDSAPITFDSATSEPDPVRVKSGDIRQYGQ